MEYLRGKLPPVAAADKIQSSPLFNGQTFAILTAQRPKFKPQIPGENQALEKYIQNMGLPYQKVYGFYNGWEESFLVYGIPQEAAATLGKKFGQESIVWSKNHDHRMLYTNGPNVGKYNPPLNTYEFWDEKEGESENFYTNIPGGSIRLHFDFDQLKDAGLKYEQPLTTLPKPPSQENLAKSFQEPNRQHPHSYPWHNSHTDFHPKKTCPGGIAFSGGRKLIKSDEDPWNQSAPVGVSTYAKLALPYGTIDRSRPSNLVHYNLNEKSSAIDQLIRDHGYQVYYAGGKHGKPDLANKNYNTKYLMVYDPGSANSFDDYTTTDNWRKIHELAHAITLPDINQLYGEGKRLGRLGKHISLREAKRAVHWEWLAGHKQRELASQIGVHLPEETFNKEMNTVMHDALHRAITGKFTEPSGEGFHPHSHLVPLHSALATIDSEAHNLGIQGNHEIMSKSDNVSTEQIRLGLAETLKKSLASYETTLLELRQKELAKSSPPGRSKEVEDLKAKGMPASEAFGIAWKQYKSGGKPIQKDEMGGGQPTGPVTSLTPGSSAGSQPNLTMSEKNMADCKRCKGKNPKCGTCGGKGKVNPAFVKKKNGGPDEKVVKELETLGKSAVDKFTDLVKSWEPSKKCECKGKGCKKCGLNKAAPEMGAKPPSGNNPTKAPLKPKVAPQQLAPKPAVTAPKIPKLPGMGMVKSELKDGWTCPKCKTFSHGVKQSDTSKSKHKADCEHLVWRKNNERIKPGKMNERTFTGGNLGGDYKKSESAMDKFTDLVKSWEPTKKAERPSAPKCPKCKGSTKWDGSDGSTHSFECTSPKCGHSFDLEKSEDQSKATKDQKEGMVKPIVDGKLAGDEKVKPSPKNGSGGESKALKKEEKPSSCARCKSKPILKGELCMSCDKAVKEKK